MNRPFVPVLASIVALYALACHGDSTTSGGTPASPDPDEDKPAVTAAISAATGGLLQTASGRARVIVPPGALAADTTLSVVVKPTSGDAQTSIYEFGPEGTQFLMPINLSILYDGTPGNGMRAVLGYRDGSNWTEIPGSSVAAGFVTGRISHFSHYAVIWVY
ncbi:MAG: hypothetical protein WCP21_05610, partial [Armatimonadota bacterium]